MGAEGGDYVVSRGERNDDGALSEQWVLPTHGAGLSRKVDERYWSGGFKGRIVSAVGRAAELAGPTAELLVLERGRQLEATRAAKCCWACLMNESCPKRPFPAVAGPVDSTTTTAAASTERLMTVLSLGSMLNSVDEFAKLNGTIIPMFGNYKALFPLLVSGVKTPKAIAEQAYR